MVTLHANAHVENAGRMASIRTTVIVLLACCLAGISFNASAATAPLVQETSIAIPRVPVGPYSDHLAVDPVGMRLFATPQAAKAVAVLDLRSGKLLMMIGGIGDPHGVFYSEKLGRLFVVDGASGDVKVYSGPKYSLIRTIPVMRGADSLVYDPSSRVIYVNSSGEDRGMAHSFVSAVDIVRMTKVRDIPIQTGYLEASALDSKRNLLYVEGESEIFVVDLGTGRTLHHWWILRKHRNKDIALDATHARLYLACRDSSMHGSVVVLNSNNGRLLTTLPIGGWVDGIFLDARRERIYLSTGVGYIETYSIGPHDEYHRESPVETEILAKTGLYSTALNRLYIDAPHLGDFGTAKVMVFRPMP